MLSHLVGNGLPTSCVVCADPIYVLAEASRKWVKAHGWKMLEIAAGHDAMVIAPDLLAALLEADAV
jgi:hypothetical protein